VDVSVAVILAPAKALPLESVAVPTNDVTVAIWPKALAAKRQQKANVIFFTEPPLLRENPTPFSRRVTAY
jgi:hypothetical protein